MSAETGVDPLSALGFTSWPFVHVPDEYNTTFSCDREWLVQSVTKMLNSYKLRDTSIINLMWSDVGAGKTHTLLNLKYRAAQLGFDSCIYFELPNGVTSFSEIARSFIHAVGLESLLSMFGNDPSRFKRSAILDQLCRAAYTGLNTEYAARAWVDGSATVTDCKTLGIPRILTSEQAIDIVQTLANAMKCGSPERTIILIDEFQRVAARSRTTASALQASFCSLINRMPKHLTLILSFQAPPADRLPEWFDKSLSSRAGHSHFLPLVALDKSQAEVFLAELVQRYRTSNTCLNPFSADTIKKIVELSGEDKILPRDLIMNASHVFERYLDSAAFPGKIPPDLVRLQL